MALNEYKVKSTDSGYRNVQAQEDTLSGTAAENKEVFDAYPDLVASKHNSLINELLDTKYEASDNPILGTIPSDNGWHDTGVAVTFTENGYYLFVGAVRFPSNATGRRQILQAIRTGEEGSYQYTNLDISVSKLIPVSGTTTTVSTVSILNVTAPMTVVMRANQNSGTEMNVNSYYSCIRLAYKE